MAEIEKYIAFKIQQQFPAIYREEGPELVKLAEEYYRFMESQPNQSVYNARRMFEYRDIGTTLSSMIIFYQKKYLADLPLLDESTIRFIVKNILALYRRKGTEAGIILFFRMFYQEDVEVIYPAQYMLKPSDSDWKTGEFLQLFPNDGNFYSSSGTLYTYLDLISQSIIGSISKATAIVDRINFISINGTSTPVLYLTKTKGRFIKFDNIVSRFSGEDVSFGVLNGSASSLEIDLNYAGTSGNNIGDIFNIESATGIGGKAIVTDIQDEFTGTVNYTIVDGGYGYTRDNTKLLVSNQSLILKNEDLSFTVLETLRDSANNEGVVIGQNETSVGLRMRPGEEFDITRPISTVDRSPNVVIPVYNRTDGTGKIFSITIKNESSPGDLYPEQSPGDANTDVIVNQLGEEETVSLITDVIQGYVNVNINASNYNDPPATQPMSGNTNPVTLSTPLNQAFDLTPFDIGRIISFKNVNPGSNYVNDVFAIARDEVIEAFERFEQNVLLENFSATFSVGDEVVQSATGVSGLITAIDNVDSFLRIRPYSYYGFKSGFPITFKGVNYDVIAVERDYSSAKYGANAVINARTLFSTGRISEAKILNSGLGYIDGQEVFLVDEDGVRHARAIIRAESQGITEGFWGKLNSHINGFRIKPEKKVNKNILPTTAFAEEVLNVVVGVPTTPPDFETWLLTTASDGYAYGDMDKSGAVGSSDSLLFVKLAEGVVSGSIKARWDNIVAPSLRSQSWFEFNPELYTYVDVLEYFDSKTKIQDSDYYQEYSYEIRSTIDKNLYDEPVKSNMHLSGTKMFGEFIYKQKASINITASMFTITKDDYVIGGDPIVGPNQPGDPLVITSDSTAYSVDADTFTADLV
jgi:hypothetical protein